MPRLYHMRHYMAYTARHVGTYARGLGGIVARYEAESLEDFVQSVMRAEPTQVLVNLVLQSRVDRTRRRTVGQLRALWQAGQRGRWLTATLQTAYGLYCLLRQSAVPGVTQPLLEHEHGVHFPRTLQRVLRSRGIRGETVSQRGTIHARACTQVRALWAAMADASCILWVDNYYRKRVLANPAVGYTALSCTVMSLLRTTPLPMNPPPLAIRDLVQRRGAVMVGVVGKCAELLHKVANVTSEDIALDEIRVPLDTRRQHVQSLQWTPFLLSELSVSSTADFVQLLGFIRDDVDGRCRSPLPVLVDLNLYYRFMKLAYGLGYVRWRVRHDMRFCPPLFAVWHAYKYCCMAVFRAFHAQYVFLLHGTVQPGDRFPTAPRLRSIELLFAAVLLVSTQERQELRALVTLRHRQVRQAQIALDVHDTWVLALRRGRSVHAGVPQGSQAGGGGDRREGLVAARAAAEMLLQHAVAMEALVNQYIPACFVVGHRVRECNWNGRRAGTASHAHDVMAYAFSILLPLIGPRNAPGTEHLRDVTIALLFWEDWHDGLFGCAFSEEGPEASLGRFASTLRANPHVTTVEDACDLWCLVSPGRRGYKDLRANVPTEGLCDRVRANLRTFLQAPGRVVSYVPWSPDRMCIGEAAWPPEYQPPSRLGSLPGAEYLKNLCLYYIRRMFTSPPVPPGTPVFSSMEETFSRTSQAAQRAYQQECAAVRPDTDWQVLAGNFHSYNAPVSAENIPPPVPAASAFRGGRWHRTQSHETLLDEE